MLTLEKTILKNLIKNEDYSRKVLPYLKADYFDTPEDRAIFVEIEAFVLKYNVQPAFDALAIEIGKNKQLNDDQTKTSKKIIDDLKNDAVESNIDWLKDVTEKFVQDKAMYMSLVQSLDIIQGKNKTYQKGSIPQIMMDALSISFDPNIGHDFLQDFEARYDYYHKVEHKIPFGLKKFNEITKGGVSLKTLTIILAGTGVGKSLTMCHMAADNLNQGKNVLYITLELSAFEVAKRIDANLLNIEVNDLLNIPKDLYEKKVDAIKKKTTGKLIVKEYPTASASAMHFKALLNDLALKKNFRPDVVYLDYINLCLSSRIKPSAGANTYVYIKSIAEELRGLAVEYNLALVSATQLNRQGFTDSDPGLDSTAESFGLPATADLMFVLIDTEDLRKLNQILVKQLKNRYDAITHLTEKFVVGIEKSKMRLYDVEPVAQQNIIPTNPPESRANKFKTLKVE